MRTWCHCTVWGDEIVITISVEVSTEALKSVPVFRDAIYVNVQVPWGHLNSNTSSRSHANLKENKVQVFFRRKLGPTKVIRKLKCWLTYREFSSRWISVDGRARVCCVWVLTDFRSKSWSKEVMFTRVHTQHSVAFPDSYSAHASNPIAKVMSHLHLKSEPCFGQIKLCRWERNWNSKLFCVLSGCVCAQVFLPETLDWPHLLRSRKSQVRTHGSTCSRWHKNNTSLFACNFRNVWNPIESDSVFLPPVKRPQMRITSCTAQPPRTVSVSNLQNNVHKQTYYAV